MEVGTDGAPVLRLAAGDGRRRARLDLRTLLDAAEAAPPVGCVQAIGAVLERELGARDVSFLIADFTGRSLVRLGRRGETVGGRRALGGETAQSVSLEATPQGRALERQRIEVEALDDGFVLHAPVTSRGEAVGILEVGFAGVPDADDIEDVQMAAHALAYVLIANRRYTDLFEWGRRSVPISLAAEIQHRLLPGSYTCEAGQFTLAAWLEPAGEVGGDTFDFSLERDTLHLSMTDAMGHTVEASLLATVLVGALRNARRQGVDLAEQARIAHECLVQQARSGEFVTGQLARVDLLSGRAVIVNAGHPPPLRIRGGHAAEISLEPQLPFGTMPATEYRVQALPLEPGDRILFITDGMLGREGTTDELRRPAVEGFHLHPREAVQHLSRVVLDQHGGELRDDATVMCLDWHGGPPRERDAYAGADLRG